MGSVPASREGEPQMFLAPTPVIQRWAWAFVERDYLPPQSCSFRKLCSSASGYTPSSKAVLNTASQWDSGDPQNHFQDHMPNFVSMCCFYIFWPPSPITSLLSLMSFPIPLKSNYIQSMGVNSWTPCALPFPKKVNKLPNLSLLCQLPTDFENLLICLSQIYLQNGHYPRTYMKGQWTHEKMFNIISHGEMKIKNLNVISVYIHWNG